MTKFLKNLWSVAVIAIISMFFFSCEKEQKTEPEPEPVFSIVSIFPDEIDVPVEGGDEFQVSYKIENPVENAKLGIKCDADWIYDFNLETEGQIFFKVAKKETPEARQYEVKLIYPNLEEGANPFFTVRQAEGVPAPFKITIDEITKNSAIGSIYPEDKEMTYLTFLLDSVAISQYPDDESLFQSDIQNIRDMAEYEFKIPFEELISNYIQKGDIVEQPITGIMPSTKYILYAYGFDMNTVEKLTDIVKAEFTTESVVMTDATFDIHNNISGTDASIDIIPNNYDGYYFFDIFQGLDDTMPAEKIEELLNNFWANWLNNFFRNGITAEMILMNMCHQGSYTQQYPGLRACESYLSAAFAVDDGAFKCSKVSYKSFYIDKPAPSDIQVDIQVSDVRVRKAAVRFVPSNYDPYAAGFIEAWEVDGMNDEQILDFIANSFYLPPIYGEYAEELKGLKPDTEYFVFAFGCNGGIATSALFSERFTTKEEQECDITVNVDYGKYYDTQAVGELDEDYANSGAPEGYVYVPFTVSTNPEGASFYWGVFPGEYLKDSTVTDDILINNIYGGMSQPMEIFIMPYGDSFGAIAIAEDEQGNLGPLFKGPIYTVTEDGVGDPEEFLNNFPYPNKDAFKFSGNYDLVKTVNTLNMVRKASSKIMKKTQRNIGMDDVKALSPVPFEIGKNNKNFKILFVK